MSVHTMQSFLQIRSHSANLPDKSRKRFILYFLFIPLFAAAGAFILYNLAPALSGVNSNVRLAREIRLEKKTGIESLSKAVVAFKESGKTEAQLLHRQAR